MVVRGVLFVPVILFLITPSTLFAYYLTFKKVIKGSNTETKTAIHAPAVGSHHFIVHRIGL
jgi:hypothetical protein